MDKAMACGRHQVQKFSTRMQISQCSACQGESRAARAKQVKQSSLMHLESVAQQCMPEPVKATTLSEEGGFQD